MRRDEIRKMAPRRASAVHRDDVGVLLSRDEQRARKKPRTSDAAQDTPLRAERTATATAPVSVDEPHVWSGSNKKRTARSATAGFAEGKET